MKKDFRSLPFLHLVSPKDLVWRPGEELPFPSFRENQDAEGVRRAGGAEDGRGEAGSVTCEGSELVL